MRIKAGESNKSSYGVGYKAPVFPAIEKPKKIDVFNSSIDSTYTNPNITNVTSPAATNSAGTEVPTSTLNSTESISAI